METIRRNQRKWTLQGRDFFFDTAYVTDLDGKIRNLSRKGIVVNLIILAYKSDNMGVDQRMLHPSYDSTAPNHLGAFNSKIMEGCKWLTATMEFVAERWSRLDRKHGRVAGYVIGNEVNSHSWWSNLVRVTMLEFTENYLDAVRLIHGDVRRQSSWASVYVSLDHHWNIRYPPADEMQAFAGKLFIDYFAKLAREGEAGNFDWHLAFHPYPENLFDARFWNDKTALPHD